MDILFDQRLIEANRKRALRTLDEKALFLLDIAADEIAERLVVVERQFETAVELHGATGITARRIMQPGKVAAVHRGGIDSSFAHYA